MRICHAGNDGVSVGGGISAQMDQMDTGMDSGGSRNRSAHSSAGVHRLNTQASAGLAWLDGDVCQLGRNRCSNNAVAQISCRPVSVAGISHYAMLGILQVIVSSYHWIGLSEWNSFGRLVTFGLLLPLPIGGLRNAERIAERGSGGRVQETWQMTMASIAILSLGHQFLRLWDLGVGTHLFLASIWVSAAVSFLYERNVRPTYA